MNKDNNKVMGWKGTLRSINSAVRAAERDAKRRHRELERRQKEYAKMLELERAAYEVELFQNQIDRLVSLHRECSKSVDWKSIAEAPPPNEPTRKHKGEDQAHQAWNSYEPSFIDKLFKRADSKKAALLDQVEAGRRADEKKYQMALARYQEQLADWREGKEFAERILRGEEETYLEAINELNAFDEIAEIGSSVSLTIDRGKPIEAVLHVNGERVVPREEKSLLKTGRLSIKQMHIGKYYELYQDSVCSVVIRIAREIFAILPVEMVIVTATDNLLNSSTGHLEEQPIVSVAFSRNTLQKLNVDAIDPSESLRNFVHRMDFKKTKGFGPVQRIRPYDLQATPSGK